jgi:hypothetical protein
MQTATILLSLGGERDNQVPKYNVTPAEALLLQALHGTEAVTDVQVGGTVKTTAREERMRLFAVYSRPNPRGGRLCPELDALFPGVAARLPTDFADIELDESFYKTGAAPDVADEQEQAEANEAPEGAPEGEEETANLFN